VCEWERLFCFLLYLISQGEFPSSHPDYFEVQTTMNGNLPPMGTYHEWGYGETRHVDWC
jgi:hypothetical protein